MTTSPPVLAPPALPGLATVPHEPGGGVPRRRLSIARTALAALTVLGVLAAAGVTVARSMVTVVSPVRSAAWFAPYVDVTLTPLFQFQNPYANPARQAVLGFVVADPQRPCEPSWGGVYGLDQAAGDLNLDRRVAEVQSQGGDVIVSFGGVAHTELAVSCADPATLRAAYSQVIARYKATTVDLDLEGDALGRQASERRAAALAALQEHARASGGTLDVWLTLPVGRSGLDDGPLAVIRTTLAAGVRLAGVNVMAMDFGGPERDMGGAVHDALTATQEQLAPIFAQHGIAGSSAATWRHLAATVMLGQNDSSGEIFTTADARRLVQDAADWRLARVSMWSLNRDRPCGKSFSLVVHSNVCSGVDQDTLEFASILGGLTGVAGTADDDDTPASPKDAAQTVVDNPATSPYPLWRPARSYVAGYKVVRGGNVYQARWFTRGDDPSAPVGHGSQKPWQLLGPVLPGDHPTPPTPVPDGTYPRWSATEVYPLGARVLFHNLPYQARWQSKAASPADEETDPSVSPWQALFSLPGEPLGS
jgi:chitinase